MEEYYFYTEGLTVGYHGVPLIKNIKISLTERSGKNDDPEKHHKTAETAWRSRCAGWKRDGTNQRKRAFQKTFGCADRTGKTGNDDLQRSGCDRTLSIYREVRRTLKRRLETGR